MTPATRILTELIRIPSVNPMGRHDCDPAICGEARVSEFLIKWLSKRGISVQVQPVSQGRDNVIATIPASVRTSATMLWEVHQDTVPVDNMTIAPFEGIVRDGKVFGRGACDVKGSMAAFLSALEILTTTETIRTHNLIVGFTVDEEHTFLGVQKLAAGLEGILPEGWSRPAVAVVAEPTGLDLVVSHKGVVRWRIELVGRACHSSMPWNGVNALYGAGPALMALERLANDLLNGPKDSVLGSATLSVGMIRGGSAPNIVPDSCEIIVDRRLIPGETPEDATRQLRNALQSSFLGREGLVLRVEDPWLKCPPLPESVPAVLRESILAAARSHYQDACIRSVNFGTDASTLCQAGIPSFVFGPGSIDQAHTKDEWIEIGQLNQSVAILVDWVTTPLLDDTESQGRYNITKSS